jgi:hypothetical protein
VRNATAHCAARAQTFELFEVRDGAPETVSYTDTGLAVAALQAEAARTRLTVHVRFRCRRSAG